MLASDLIDERDEADILVVAILWHTLIVKKQSEAE